VVVIQSRAAGAGNVKEIEVALEEAFDGRLVGGIEHRAAGTPPARDLIPQL
jgi:hypothetical protein